MGESMKPTLFLCILLMLTIACGPQPSSTQNPSDVPKTPKVVIEKEKAEKEQPLPSEVKIRLKRDGKDNYSWELSGSDVDQVLKVNEKLKKGLDGEPKNRSRQ